MYRQEPCSLVDMKEPNDKALIQILAAHPARCDMACVGQHTATYYNTLQHTAAHCSMGFNTLQHTASHCSMGVNTLQHTATHCNALKKTLQHTAAWESTHCNTLQCTDCDMVLEPS